jgi:hypothetical protein
VKKENQMKANNYRTEATLGSSSILKGFVLLAGCKMDV